MQNKEEPVITPSNNKESYTSITFYPDLKLFRMQSLENDIAALFCKRAYDLAGITDANVNITLNNKRIAIKNFNQYCDLYLKSAENKDLPKIVEKK